MNNIKRNKHVKKILLVERDGQFKSDTQSLEDFVHFKVSESQWLPAIHLTAQFWMIRQTKLVLTINNLFADLFNTPNFLSPNAQKE